MSRISYAYDPLNGLTLDCIMNPYECCERTMAIKHISEIEPSNCAEDLYLFDRGYPSIGLIFSLNQNNKQFVCRSNTNWLSIVNQVFKSGKKDEIVEINPRMLKGEKIEIFKKQFPNVCLKSTIKLRVLNIELPTGEQEILVSSLLDKRRFPYKIFKDLYHLRWGVEENYKFHKVRLEVENFSGKTTHAIEQDFNATVFIGNARAIIAQEAEEEEEQTYQKKYKYEYKINKNISISVLKDSIIQALLDPENDLQVFCENIKKTMKRSIVPIKPERMNLHTRKNCRKYPMNRRRAL